MLAPGTPIPTTFDYAGDTVFEHLADPRLTPHETAPCRAAQLQSPDEIAQAAGLTPTQVIDLFDLQPILDLIANH